MTDTVSVPHQRPRNLTDRVQDALATAIRTGQLPVDHKLPTEAALMAAHGVSRTVVREAISKLQAGGLVQTRHGIGTFVMEPSQARGLRLAPEQRATLQDVIALLELRIGIETEAAALAALRRSDDNLTRIRRAWNAFALALDAGADTVGPDFQFHLEVARATQNQHFSDFMHGLGERIIPRARLRAINPLAEVGRRDYLRGVHDEHERILEAIALQDAEAARAAMRTHLSSSRERRRRAAAA